MLDNGGGLRPGSLERERLRYQTARRTSRYNAGGAAFDDSSDALLGTDPCSEPASIRADLRERLGVNDDENGSGEQPEGFAERMEELDPTIAKQKASDTLYSQPLVPWTIPLISLKTVRDGLEADQALLMLVVTNDATTVLGITKDENTDFLRNVAIPSNELKAKIDQLRRSVSGAPLSTLASQRFPLETAAELYTTLLGPWVDSLPASVHKIIYLSSTPLDSLPLDLLVEQLPATLALTEFDDYRQAKWLGDRFELRMLPAVSREAIREKSALSNRTKGDTHFLGFGAPTLTSVDDCSATSAANRSRTVGHLCELPDTEDLLVDLSRVFESNETQKISCDSTATSLAPISPCYVRNAFKQSFLHSEPMRKILSQAGVIAFATHGLTSQEVVALGGDSEPALVATPSAETSGDDGLLSASEIATLNLSADLVILSACNSAASDGNPDSETLSGLGQAFFLAGAKSLLVSSWAIDEKATVALISGLANNLQAGRSTGNALQKSIKTIRDGAGDALPAQYAHPVYWAAFSLVGAP
jgi:CHAT domain-containing protein